MRSIMGSGTANIQKDPLIESSFNKSFQASTDKFGSTVRSQIASQHQANRAAVNHQRTPQAHVEARGVRQNTGASALMNYGLVERHQDSLFESSKASTSNQTSIMRRQFNKNQAQKQPTLAMHQNQRQVEMLGAAVFGSKVQPSHQLGGTVGMSAIKAGSTKPGSQVTEITSNMKQFTTEDKGARINKRSDESALEEASFAAPAQH